MGVFAGGHLQPCVLAVLHALKCVSTRSVNRNILTFLHLRSLILELEKTS